LGINLTLLCIPEYACLEAGHGETYCSLGYEGVGCSKCSSGYFRLGNSCKKCISEALKWTVIVISSIVLVLVSRKLWATISRIPISVRVAMSWFQMFALLPLLSDKWPSQLSVLFDIAKIGNLEFQYFGFDCDLKVTFWFTWLAKLWFPVILLAIIFCFWLMQKLSKMEFEIHKMLNVIVFFVNFFYTSIFGSVLEPFNCVEQTDGSYDMKVSPDIKCFEESWKSYLPSSIFFILFYVFLLPLISFFAFIPYQASQDHLFAGIYQAMTNPYRLGCEFWEWIRLVSDTFLALANSKAAQIFKFVFVLIRDVTYIDEGVKKLLIIALVTISLLLDASHQPFKNLATNHVSSL
jgi:hypothetical protein